MFKASATSSPFILGHFKFAIIVISLLNTGPGIPRTPTIG